MEHDPVPVEPVPATANHEAIAEASVDRPSELAGSHKRASSSWGRKYKEDYAMIKYKAALIGIAFLLVLPIALMADPIQINVIFDGVSGADTWTWAGGAGSVLTSQASAVTVQLVGSSTVVPLTVAVSTIKSGAAIGGSGTTADPFTFGPGGAITITGCGGTCFTGSFSGAAGSTAEIGINGTSTTGLVFSSTALEGTFNSMVYTLLGLPSSTPTSVLGNLTANLAFTTTPTFAAGGSGTTAAGTSVDTVESSPAVPEPASFLMFGTGLLALGVLLRRKLAASA